MEPVYKTIENYVNTHNLQLSNEPGDTTRQYRIFGARIFFHANDLAGAITDIIPYVRMNTVVREKEFEIQIDGARVVRLYNIDPTFAKIIAPCTSNNSAGLNKIPAEVELVDVYHRLYSPNEHSAWEMLRNYEEELWRSFITSRAQVSECDEKNTGDVVVKKDERGRSKSPGKKKRSRSRDRNAKESSTASASDDQRISGGCSGAASNDSQLRVFGGIEDAHIEIVTRWLSKQQEYAIVGNFALTCMNGKQCPVTGAMQIIVNDVARAVSSLSAELSKFIPQAKIESRQYDLQLPTDYRIKKYVILARIGRDIYYIANLFNCASFELIPITSIGGLRIATPDVILRFLFIELWFVRVVHGFGKMTNSEYAAMVKTIFANVDTVRASWHAQGPIVSQPTYIGTYINESISKKTEDMIPPYYPAQYKREHGVYRNLQTTH